MPEPPEAGNNIFTNMPAVICDAPSCLIPKELFQEEKIPAYWSALYNIPIRFEDLGKDDLENFFLLYPNSKNADSIHEISLMYNRLKEKFPEPIHAICLSVHENNFNILALKESQIVYTGYFQYAVNEDILYHLTNIAQQFLENISPVTFFFQQLPPSLLRLLNNYFDMMEL
jgi:hypothetical protein